MLVKFNKKQIKALASIQRKAELMFDEFQRENPSLFRNDERKHTIDIFRLGIIDSIIELGAISTED